MRSIIAMAGILFLCTAPLTAQTLQDLKPGDRLVIQKDDNGEEYVLESKNADTLFVSKKGGDVASPIHVSEVEGIRVRVPRSTGSGALIGALIGGGVGGLIGGIIAVASPEEAEECGPFDDFCEAGITSAKVVGYVGLVGMMGLAAGAVIGAAAPGNQWKPVQLEAPLSLRIDTQRATICVRCSWLL